MNRIRNHSKELIVLTILLAIAVSVVNAAVFVYYPMTITAQWVKPLVYFAEGSNAGKRDVTGTIEVNPGDDGASVSITVHPCRRQTTYYKNVTIIVNDDTQAYYVWIRLKTPFNDGSISHAYLIVERDGSLDLKSGTTIGPIPLSGSGPSGPGLLSIDLKFEIDSSGTTTDTAVLELIYSPQSTESPP